MGVTIENYTASSSGNIHIVDCITYRVIAINMLRRGGKNVKSKVCNEVMIKMHIYAVLHSWVIIITIKPKQLSVSEMWSL